VGNEGTLEVGLERGWRAKASSKMGDGEVPHKFQKDRCSSGRRALGEKSHPWIQPPFEPVGQAKDDVKEPQHGGGKNCAR